MNPLNELKQLWPSIPPWARAKILQIATISVKRERWKMVVLPSGKFADAIGGKYSVSNLGRLKNISTDKIVTQYNSIISNRPVHRIVATTWVKGHSKGKNTVMHLDGDGTNNYYRNLKWGTVKENAP